MKKLIALVLTLMFTLTAVAAFAEEPAATEEPSKTLVVYYSATGSTEPEGLRQLSGVAHHSGEFMLKMGNSR